MEGTVVAYRTKNTHIVASCLSCEWEEDNERKGGTANPSQYARQHVKATGHQVEVMHLSQTVFGCETE